MSRIRYDLAKLARFGAMGFRRVTCYAPYQEARRIDHAERQ
jgi:hypothetical protein